MKNNIRILVVDDDRDICEVLKDLLEMEAFMVKIAYNGMEALEAVRTNSIDIVLMDIKMPVMDGLEAFRQMKVISPDMPVVMVSAYSDDETTREAIREGARASLRKPVDFDDLLKTIQHEVSIEN